VRGRVLRPPDLTSLFDVLFILVFVSLVNAGINQQERDAAKAPAAASAVPAASAIAPPTVRALHDRALAEIGTRTALVARITPDGTLRSLELGGRQVTLAEKLLAPSPLSDVGLVYRGDREPDVRVCKLAAQHLGLADLAPHLVILTPDAPLESLSHALVVGMRRDAERCSADQRGIAVVVEPTAVVDPKGTLR